MHYVMEAATPLVTQNPNITLILGIAWYIFAMICIIVILIGLVFGILITQRLKLKRSKEKAIGCVLLEVLPTTGGTIPIAFELCKWHKGETKTMEDTSRGTFSSPMWAEAPKGHSVDSYLLPDEHDYCLGWPLGAPEIEQTVIPVYIVHKNFPWPECPHDAKKWDNDMIIKRSSAMFNQSNNEASMQVIMSPQMAFAEQLRLLVDKMKWVVIAAICSGAAAAFALVGIGINWFMVGQRIDAIAKFLIGQ